MKVMIDGKEVEIYEADKNIVEVAARAGVVIPAPCYRGNREKGCCQACVVEVDGKEAYACVTKPDDGMRITVSREDLNQLRKERVKAYGDRPVPLFGQGGDCPEGVCCC